MSALPLLALLAGLWASPEASPPPTFAGRWVTDAASRPAVDPWRDITLDVRVEGPRVTLVRRFSTGRRTDTDSLTVPFNGRPTRVPFPRWLDSRHLGVWPGGDGTKQVAAAWLDDGRTLQLVTTMTVQTSQGTAPMRVLDEYRLSPDGTRITVIELRSGRPTPVVYTYVRPS